MYKVLVADDEPLILEGWKTMVDWHSCGYELIGTASDGEEALTLAKSDLPDLLVTDIRMPVLDGLGLIRAMKEELGASSKTVVVSGYSEFEYARQAIRYQVDRYVLKPLVPEEIHALLRELSGPLAERRRAMTSGGQPDFASLIVRLLKYGEPAVAETVERQLGAGGQTRFRVVLAEACGAADGAGSRQDAKELLRQFAEQALEGQIPYWLFQDAPGRAGLLAREEDGSTAAFERRIREAASALGWPLREMALYCSEAAAGIAAAPALYRQALGTIPQVRPGSRAGVYTNRAEATAGGFRLKEFASLAGTLIQAIVDGDVEAVGRFADELLRLFGPSEAGAGWSAAIRYIKGELLLKEIDRQDASPEFDLFSESLARGEDLKRLCLEAAERRARRQSPGRSAAIRDAVSEVRARYREKLRLKELAERFGMSPVYFGQLFKQETGSAFNDFVHRLRIEEARRLIRRTDMKVAEIAAALGYHDSEYFTAKFKELTGMLPSVYKFDRGRDGGADSLLGSP
jgi:two-component system response regulator YesN